MLPRPGFRAAVIEIELADAIRDAWNHAHDVRAYMAWVYRLERTLRECFTSPPLERLYTDRFWHITAGAVRGDDPEMIRLEIEVQLEWLGIVLAAVQKMRARFGEPAGEPRQAA